MGRLRVGLVCGHFDPARDGVADYTRHLAGGLRAGGCEALVCTARRYAGTRTEEVVGVTDGWGVPGVLRAARILARLSLDVVHVQFAPSAFGFSRAVGLLPLLLPAGVPVVATLHEYGVWTADGVGGPLRAAAWSAAERRWGVDRETLALTRRAARLLVTAPEHAEVVAARCPGREAAFLPIASNIPVPRAGRADPRGALRARLGLPGDAALVVFFGFLHPVKGLDRLIEALAAVRRVLPGVRLVLAGGEQSHSVRQEAATAMRRRLEDTARRCGVADAVSVTGYLPAEEVSGLLQGADAAVFPFDAGVTAKSGSLLAALGHGVPTVATAPPGVLDRPTEVDGVLRVPPRDTAALADALLAVLSDRALAARLAAAGPARSAGWTWSQIAGFHARTYTELIRGSRPPGARGASGPRAHRGGREGR
ncbi:glycosyltransferase [Geodermatophilus sp. TF02-6]|uniref:glycosyltransferase n=1 Tax=Geodermatophilus sp. TF02-6 TaxID=2250575 RepID=UPI001314D5EA|nr:glycosyltransferase [Geodermatophilus sp. TF02-6]